MSDNNKAELSEAFYEAAKLKYKELRASGDINLANDVMRVCLLLNSYPEVEPNNISDGAFNNAVRTLSRISPLKSHRDSIKMEVKRISLHLSPEQASL
jgi:hypothetical protein